MMRPRLPCIIPVIGLSVIALENERGVGAAEAEGVGKNGVHLCVVDALAHDRNAFELWIEIDDMSAFANEALLHHQDRVDRFLNTRCPQRMARQRLGRLDMRDLVSEDFSDSTDFL